MRHIPVECSIYKCDGAHHIDYFQFNDWYWKTKYVNNKDLPSITTIKFEDTSISLGSSYEWIFASSASSVEELKRVFTMADKELFVTFKMFEKMKLSLVKLEFPE